MLVWCLKQVKDLIPEVLISCSFFSEKTTSDYHAMIMVSYPLGTCEDEVTDSHASYQGNRYNVHFLWCHTFTLIHSVNGEEVS